MVSRLFVVKLFTLPTASLMVGIQINGNQKMLKDALAPPPREINHPPVILIADDDEDSREMLRFLLESWSYRVLEAKDGKEAVRLTKTRKPNLILMDVKMPDLDGFETARAIRESSDIDGVPIIFLSGCAEKIYRRRASEAGGDGYLVKPLDFEKLEKMLGKYIQL